MKNTKPVNIESAKKVSQLIDQLNKIEDELSFAFENFSIKDVIEDKNCQDSADKLFKILHELTHSLSVVNLKINDNKELI